MLSKTLVYFDLETAGLELHHPIIQLAAIAVKDGHVIEQFEAKVDFDISKAEQTALEINNYSPEAWANAEKPELIVTRFASWLNRFKCVEKISKAGKPYKVCQLAGYNAHAFDGPRLIKLFQDHQVFFPANYRVLDVLQLAMWYFEINSQNQPENYKLATICNFFDVPLTNAHDALADVMATAQLAEKLLSKN